MTQTVESAQVHNASRMTNDDLLRELRIAISQPEQPAIRQDWIRVLRAEIERRGLDA